MDPKKKTLKKKYTKTNKQTYKTTNQPSNKQKKTHKRHTHMLTNTLSHVYKKKTQTHI